MNCRCVQLLLIWSICFACGQSLAAASEEFQPHWLAERADSGEDFCWQAIYDPNDVYVGEGRDGNFRLLTISPEILVAMSKIRNLARLDLSSEPVASKLSSSQFLSLCNHESLIWVDLSGFRDLTTECLAALAKLPCLKTLRMNYIGYHAGSRELTLAGLRELVRSQSIEILEVGISPAMFEDDYPWYETLAGLRSLRIVRIGSVGAAAAAAISELPSLRYASASTNEAVDVLVHRLRTLQSLRLSGNAITKESFWELERGQALRELVFDRETSSWDLNEVSASFSKCTELRSITFSGVYKVDYRVAADQTPNRWLNDDALKHLLVSGSKPICAKLTSLNLGCNPGITSAGIAAICEAYPHLVYLSLNGCSALDGRALDAISALKNLRHLEIGSAFVGNKLAKPAFVPDDAAKLAKLMALESLDLSGTDPKFAKEALSIVMGLKKLRVLRMTNCGLDDAALANAPQSNLSSADFEANQFTNNGLRDATKLMPKLEALCLSNGRHLVIQDLPEALSGFSTLTSLRIRAVELDSDTLAAIRKKLPKCAIDR